MFARILLASLFALTAAASAAHAADRDWAPVAQALGKEGTLQPGGVYKVGLPRTDLHVTLDGVALKAGFALGSWLAFEPAGAGTLVMGDLVLTQDEVNPVMRKLEESGIEITALHNHLLRAEPATMYMHVMGHGDAVALARSLHAALALSRTPFSAAASAAPTERPDLDVAAIDKLVGAKGKDNGGILQYSVQRKEEVREGGMDVPAALGAATGINFQPTGGGKAAITGDLVLTAKEVNPVVKALRAHDIEVTAIHNHMLDEAPRLFFLHFWANDDAQKLAKGLRAALDKMDTVRS